MKIVVTREFSTKGNRYLCCSNSIIITCSAYDVTNIIFLIFIRSYIPERFEKRKHKFSSECLCMKKTQFLCNIFYFPIFSDRFYINKLIQSSFVGF